MKRTTVTVEVELEGAVVCGQSLRDWLLDLEIPEPLHPQDRFRVVDVKILGED